MKSDSPVCALVEMSFSVTTKVTTLVSWAGLQGPGIWSAPFSRWL